MPEILDDYGGEFDCFLIVVRGSRLAFYEYHNDRHETTLQKMASYTIMELFLSTIHRLNLSQLDDQVTQVLRISHPEMNIQMMLLNNSLVWDIFLGSRNTTIQFRRCFAGCLLILQLCTISYVFQLAIIDIFCLKLYLNHVLIKHA